MNKIKIGENVVRTTEYEGQKYFVANDVAKVLGLYQELIRTKVSTENKIAGAIKGIAGKEVRNPAFATESKFGKHYPTWVNFEGVKQLAEVSSVENKEEVLDRLCGEIIVKELEVADFKLVIQANEQGEFNYVIQNKLADDFLERAKEKGMKIFELMVSSELDEIGEEICKTEGIANAALYASMFLNTEIHVDDLIENEIKKRVKENANE